MNKTIFHNGWFTVDMSIFDYLPSSYEDIVDEPPKAKNEGCICKKCQEFYPYAEPNQEDGTLICYGCRMEW